ncbi:MAG: Gfo/Idh/MocA family oxidoreductase [Planctomycetia bacterium]|nr:Gfo/Idh/MocA family oxidoreductase [Planctomycetia bacterium]
MNARSTRRKFLSSTGGAVAGAMLAARLWDSPRILGANERLNVGCIGVGGRGEADMLAVAGENVVALCDVDTSRLDRAAGRFPSAKKYVDYRELLEQKKVDAVTIGTPDHHHAPPTVRAIRRGLHVYCEKPLTHTVKEARLVAQLAAEKKVATQMGTQNHEHAGYLRLVEWIEQGVIGPVREVHVITDRPGNYWQQGIRRPAESPPVPSDLKWDLWLGPAADRAYHPAYVPFRWRGWWDFGCGAIGDMAIHLMDPAFWALKLGGKVKVSSKGPKPLADSGPTWMETCLTFGQRGELPPCKVYWYEGTAKPPDAIGKELPMNGSLFIGDERRIAVQHDKDPVLLPAEKFQGAKLPEPYLPKSPGHHAQWIEACKTGSRTGSNFAYAGPFTEIVLLGNVAYRVGEEIEYDPKTMKVTNVTAANELLGKEYRKGWEVE